MSCVLPISVLLAGSTFPAKRWKTANQIFELSYSKAAPGLHAAVATLNSGIRQERSWAAHAAQSRDLAE